MAWLWVTLRSWATTLRVFQVGGFCGAASAGSDDVPLGDDVDGGMCVLEVVAVLMRLLWAMSCL